MIKSNYSGEFFQKLLKMNPFNIGEIVEKLWSRMPTITKFLLPIILLLMIAPIIFIQYLKVQQLTLIKQNAQAHVNTLVNLANLVGQSSTQNSQLAGQVLKAKLQKLGEPFISGNIKLNKKIIPNLIFGDKKLNSHDGLSNLVSIDAGVTSAVYVLSKQGLTLIAQDVYPHGHHHLLKENIPLSSEIVDLLLNGKDYQLLAVDNGVSYNIQYSPIIDQNKNLLGAYYIEKVVDDHEFMRVINQRLLLKNSVAAVIDRNEKVLLHSDNTPRAKIQALLNTENKEWVYIKENVSHWGATIVFAYPLSEANNIGLQNVWQLLLAAVILGLLLIFIILFQLKQLILKPIGSDPRVVINLMQKMTNGDLENDGITAESQTLLANAIDLRTKLNSSFKQLKENAQRLKLSSSVFDNAHDGIFITTVNMHIIDVNRSFTKITGYPKEAVIDQKPAHLGFGFQDPGYFEKAIVDIALKNQCRGEVWNLHCDGNVYAAWLDIFAVYDENGLISNYVGLFSDITEVKQQQKNLEHMAYHDPLTQLPNRTLFSDRLKQALKHFNHGDNLIAICYFDLDGFKPINDELGHSAGDKLLIHMAGRVRECFDESDTVARLGGDEFAILMTGVVSKSACEEKLNELLDVIKKPYDIEGSLVNVTASIGYTLYPIDLSESDTLLRHADHAMYHVKVNGRGFHHEFDANQDRLTRDVLAEKEAIYDALPRGEFRLYYQPKVDMLLGTVVGFEALIRWHSPEKGIRSPVEFLPLIEQDAQLTVQIGEWVVAEALRQIALWGNKGLTLKVSVNISAKHMVQINFSQRLKYLLDQYPMVDPTLLELEITETAVIEDIALVAKTIHQCRMCGISFALDDFGVGYSSLTYLRRLPVSVIKIDQSFIRDMLQDEGDLAVVAGVISLGQSFELSVVAEGVETAEHGVKLLNMGCHIAQGYGISKPMEADKVFDWVANYQPDSRWVNFKKKKKAKTG
jgi:diguanylate cyclase (GGDEF)-like protein/PAS domain S-box-containing protein